jgi:hypothetical protein
LSFFEDGQAKFNALMNQPPGNPSLLIGTICGYVVGVIAGAVAIVAGALVTRQPGVEAWFLMLAGLGAIGAAGGYHATMEHRQARGPGARRDLRSRCVRATAFLGLNLLVMPISLGAAFFILVLIKTLLGPGID